MALAPPFSVLAGQRGRVRDVGQVALGRRRALDLGDHGDAVGALKPSCRVNRSRGRQRGLLHILKRYGELTGALILQRSRHQFVQNRHGPPFVGVRSCATLGHVLSRLPNPSYILGYSSLVRIATEPERPTKRKIAMNIGHTAWD